jgi:hypothetical protein
MGWVIHIIIKEFSTFEKRSNIKIPQPTATPFEERGLRKEKF